MNCVCFGRIRLFHKDAQRRHKDAQRKRLRLWCENTKLVCIDSSLALLISAEGIINRTYPYFAHLCVIAKREIRGKKKLILLKKPASPLKNL